MIPHFWIFIKFFSFALGIFNFSSASESVFIKRPKVGYYAFIESEFASNTASVLKY